MLDPEDGVITILRNAGNYSPNDTESHPKIIKSTVIFLPQRPLIFKQYIFLRQNRNNIPDQTAS